MNRDQIQQLLDDVAAILTLLTAGVLVSGGTVSIDGITGTISGITGTLPISGTGGGGLVGVFAPTGVSISGTVSTSVINTPSVSVLGTVDVNIASQAADIDVNIASPLDSGAVATKEQP